MIRAVDFHPFLCRLLVGFGFLASTNTVGAIANETRDEAIARVAKYSEEELLTRMEELFDQGDPRWHTDYDICLSEIVKRSDDDWISFLQEHFDELNKKVIRFGDADRGVFGENYNLELLTALNRAKGTPDPLTVIVEPLKEKSLDPINLPRLTVALKNSGELPVGVSVGGNYRSGRLTRMRLVVTDSEGNTLPYKPWPYGIGGGLMSEQVLQPGEQLQETELILEHLVQFEKPGTYTAQVVYHNHHDILTAESIDGFIVSKSKKFQFDVSPVLIKQDKEIEQRVHSLIDELDESKSVHLLIGDYGQWAEDFVGKDSAQGQLLQIGVPAVPMLIDKLTDEETSKELAAHILGMLFTITHQNDPRVGSPIGSYKYLSDGWSIKNSVSIGQGSGTHDRGSIDEADQKELIKRWATWKENMVRER